MGTDNLFIDTNVFVRFFVRDSEKTFRECSDFLEALARGKIHAATSSIVIAEIHWLLRSYYKIDKRNIVDFVHRILSMPHLHIDNRDDAALANETFRNTSVKFIDALIASHPKIREGSIIIVSYDKDFDRLGIKRVEPRSVVS